MVVDVYSQYFAGECIFNGVERRGALVRLTSDSEAGNIRYEAGLTFFPHADEEDFAVSWDAAAAKPLYEARGRRSKKREAGLMETLREEIDSLAASMGGRVLWERPLREARYG